jgi:hypothetical protein
MSTRATRRWAAILFSLLFVGLGTGVRGQPTHRLSGIVRTTSDRPLAGATVRIEGSTVSAQADAAGAYRLSVAEGEVTLRVSHRAYQDATRTVTGRRTSSSMPSTGSARASWSRRCAPTPWRR